jgi:hypothetical protein
MNELELVEVKPGIKFSLATLRQYLPTLELVLFFAKMYELDVYQTSRLVHRLLKTDLTTALLAEGAEHSIELQDFLVEIGYEKLIRDGDITVKDLTVKGELLPEIWKNLEVVVAKSIRELTDKLGALVGTLPGKKGEMMFETLRVLNSKRPVLGDYRARVKHFGGAPNLVVLDVSGSMTERTIQAIIEDVVALSYMADAHLAIVSDTATHWEPGGFDVEAVLAAAEYCGTRYETLAALFERNWGHVITIADYDSSLSAKDAIAGCKGRIDKVVDISLVNRPTFLAECLGQLADEVQSVLVAEYSLC